MHVIPTFVAYLEHKKFLLPLFTNYFFVVIMTFGFFLIHTGMDPDLEFNWLTNPGQGAVVNNVTIAHGNRSFNESLNATATV